MRISKSKFVAGCQCVKRLYWQVHEPELAAEPDAADQAIMQQGHEVGMLARQLFPGGVEVRSDRGLDEAIRATRELVANREVPAIFEGVFEHDGRVGASRHASPPEGRSMASHRSEVHDRRERSSILMTWRFSIAFSRVWVGRWLPAVWRTSIGITSCRGGSIDPAAVLSSIRNLTRQVRTTAAQTDVSATGAVHCSRHAQRSRHRSRDGTAPIPSPASSSTAAILRSQTTTSATCHDSTRARWRSLRRWASSPIHDIPADSS